MKRIVSATAVLAIAAAVVASYAAPAPSKATAKGKTVTLKLVEKQVGFNFVDNPPHQGFDSPPLMGDQFAFTSDLLTPAGARAGTFDATCTFTRGGVNSRLACYGFYALKTGRIAGMAMIVGEGNTNNVAIVGGTGSYAGVTGYAVEVSRGNESPFTDVTIHLTYP